MKKLIVFLLVFLSIIIYPNSIVANGTSYYEDSASPTGHVMPMEEDRISIVGEELFIEVNHVDSDNIINNPAMVADIQVIYRMFNETDEELQVPIAFPQPGRTEEWSVMLDDKNVSLTNSVYIKTEELAGQNPHMEWIYPRTGKRYEFGGYHVLKEASSIQADTFTITLQPNETHTLEVNYQTTLGLDEKYSLHPVYRLDYLLHPASYWSDFNDLLIQLDVPKQASVHINLPLEEKENGRYVGVYNELPNENLALFITPKSGLVIDLFQTRWGPFLFLGGLLAIFYPLLRLIIRNINVRHSKWISISLFGLFILLAVDILGHKILGYPFTVFQIFLFLGNAIVLFILFHKGTKLPGRTSE